MSLYNNKSMRWKLPKTTDDVKLPWNCLNDKSFCLFRASCKLFRKFIVYHCEAVKNSGNLLRQFCRDERMGRLHQIFHYVHLFTRALPPTRRFFKITKHLNESLQTITTIFCAFLFFVLLQTQKEL